MIEEIQAILSLLDKISDGALDFVRVVTCAEIESKKPE